MRRAFQQHSESKCNHESGTKTSSCCLNCQVEVQRASIAEMEAQSFLRAVPVCCSTRCRFVRASMTRSAIRFWSRLQTDPCSCQELARSQAEAAVSFGRLAGGGERGWADECVQVAALKSQVAEREAGAGFIAGLGRCNQHLSPSCCKYLLLDRNLTC